MSGYCYCPFLSFKTPIIWKLPLKLFHQMNWTKMLLFNCLITSKWNCIAPNQQMGIFMTINSQFMVICIRVLWKPVTYIGDEVRHINSLYPFTCPNCWIKCTINVVKHLYNCTVFEFIQRIGKKYICNNIKFAYRFIRF